MTDSTFQFVRRFRSLFEKEAVHRKRAIWILVLTVLFVLFFLIVSGPYGLINWFRIERDRAGLEQEIRRLETEGRALRESAERLKNDPAEIERIARQKYGMAAKGEKVIKFVAPGDSLRK